MSKGFDITKYLESQVSKLEERINSFSRLYLEVGGRMCDDTTTSRILPGYEVDTKIKVLKFLENFDFIYCISARDIGNEKRRKNKDGMLLADYAIQDLGNLRSRGIGHPKIAITLYEKQKKTDEYIRELKTLGFQIYIFNTIPHYPHNPNQVLSNEGFGTYDLIPTNSNLVVVSGPGGNSGKMGFCISQIYLNNQRGDSTGFAKFETLPVWNLPLDHPVNIAYEFSTVDSGDDNLIDESLLNSKGIVAVTYNRDVENFQILKSQFSKMGNFDAYSSPTEMGINMIKDGIVDDEIIKEASIREIRRRFQYYKSQRGFDVRKESNFKRACELVEKYHLTDLIGD